jgi:hypothetical protein
MSGIRIRDYNDSVLSFHPPNITQPHKKEIPTHHSVRQPPVNISDCSQEEVDCEYGVAEKPDGAGAGIVLALVE